MKTKKVISAMLLIGAVGFANAQSDPGTDGMPTGYFEIGFGLAQPMGSYANASGSGYGGYALPGSSFNLSFGFPIAHSNFGIALMYNYAYNVYDINSYVNNVQVTDQNNSYVALQNDGYSESFILGGLYATIPIQRLSFDFRLMGGVAVCGLPESDYGAYATSPVASNNFEWDTYSSTSSAFAFDLGGGIRYRFWRTSIMAGIDYMTTNPMASTTQQYTDQFGNVTYTHIGNTVPISLLTFSIGIGYSFW